MNNKTIFKWFSMLLLVMAAGISSATAQSLVLDGFSIKAGETKDVAISLVTENNIYGIQTDLVLSEGLSLQKDTTAVEGLNYASNVVTTGATRVSLLSLNGDAIAAGEVITLTVTADKTFTAGTIAITNTRFTTTTTGTEVKVDDVTANVTLEGESLPPFNVEKVAINPADHSTLESLQNFTLTFDGQPVTVNAEVKPYIGEVEGEIALNPDGSVAISFAEAITAPGNYTLHIPSGAILYGGTAIDPLSFKYTIAGAADFTIDPAEGEVESLSTFTITFNNYMVELAENAKAYLFNEATETEIAADVYAINGGTQLLVSLAVEVAAIGDYQLNIEGAKRTDNEAEVELIFSYSIKSGVVDQNYYILSDFWGWDNPKQLEATETENVYTLVIDATVEAKAYEYKLRQGAEWGGYQLPADNNNYQYVFEEAGDYTLTFTFNLAEHSLVLDAQKKGGEQPVVEDETFELTGDMFYQWNGYGADAVSTGAATVDFKVGESLGSGAMVAGTSTVDHLIYADLTGCTKMIFEGTPGMQFRVLMNRQESNSGPLEERNPVIGDDGKGELDLTEFAYVHLNAIKTGWGSPSGTVTAIKLVKPSDPLAINKEQLKSAIGHAKMQSSFAKTTDSWNTLQQAIADGETALASATDATSLDNAKDAIVNAEAGLTLLEGYSELTADMLFSWTGWDADAVKGNQAGCAYDLFKSTSMPYGDGSVIAFADLSAYDKLQIVSTGGTPRFLFNRDVNEGQWNENEAESHLIDNTKGDANSWHAKYFSQEGDVYTVDLAQLVADKGYAHLHAIKTVGGNVVVSGMYLYKAPIIPSGTYYVMSANEGTLINAENALDAKGTPITFTFDTATNTYTIEGADFFTGKQWTIADAAEGMSGFYTISTAEGFLAVSATMTLEQIADGTADAAVWILLQKAYWEDIVNSTYTIAGTKNLTGTENDWDIVEANQMAFNEETGLFEKKFKRIAIDSENQPEFKVVQTNMAGENTWYPENNWVITTDYVGGEGLYDITITFDPSDFKEVDVIAEKRIVFPENAIVYDFEAAADAGENPANKNGSAANGQAFYGWENPEKTDSKRQDYKGYEWAEGSVLPEECHIWRRSDRINGNVAGNGGLKCPSNKEMAIDGLKAGDKVIIVYDAENATDKEIIWAIGDGSSDETLEGPRATATINGVEAVTGETTIASGAEIVINSVTPAENGSGYIVFQVKKGMVINQIAIVSMNAEWAEAIAAAQALAEEDGVAVGKLLAAIDEAKGISEPTEEQEAALQTAVDQYKLDNADQEKDETAKVATNGWKKFDGSAAGVCATQFAPAITTYDGRTAQMAECYETNGNRTGTIIYQDITGLTNGKYKVGFYGNAFSTSQRDGFECTMEDGATDVAYVFANEEKEYISARIATSTTENDFRQFDVEVTDGNIKLGMGKDTEKSTNWHTIQIYQLTWFTTAKEVFAQDQEELKAAIAEARALLADETKTEAKEAFEYIVIAAEQAVDSKMINVTELENIIGNLKDAITEFRKANWYIDLTAGDYYIIDVESGLKMAAGHDWGTRGIVNELGLDLTLTPYTESRTVTIDSRVNNNGSHFLGENLYMDSSEWGWALEYQGFGFYILEPNGGKYINIDKDNNLVLSDTPREFIIVTKDGVRAQLLEELSVATKDAPVDATGLIKANNFNRNDARNAEAWIVSADCTNKNLNGGKDDNNCAESYHSTFTIMQTISDAPAGFYQLTAQGFYRQDNYEGELPAAPVFFANEVNGNVPAKTGSENSMSDASASFTNGLYTIEPITFEVKEDGMMYIGITASTNTQWVIWDNFRLMYFGAENPTTGISNVAVEAANNGAIYNLAGQRVMNAQKGLFIINGKKVVMK